MGREVLLPQPWGELLDVTRRVTIDSLQHIDQIVITTYPVQLAGHEQTLHSPDVFGADLGPAKKPIAAA